MVAETGTGGVPASSSGDGAEVSRVLIIGPLADLPADTARRYDIDGHRLAVVRFGDDVHVIGDRCSHADYSLAEGEVDVADRTLECWKHGSTFSLDSGEPTCLPATKPVPVYNARVVDGVIQVILDDEVDEGAVPADGQNSEDGS